MNEKVIQDALHLDCSLKNHQIIVPNVNMRWGESDLLSVTRAGLIFDHEIKLSRSDYLADFRNKTYKHGIIFQKPKDFCIKCPNYFIYVCPTNLIKLAEIPVYAGLYYVKNGLIEVIKKPPRLHSEKIKPAALKKLARSLMFRYWNLRTRTN
jgi:hypothetical protein